MKPTFFMMLSSLLLVQYAKCKLYYVRPTDPENITCPGTPCQTLNDYIKKSESGPVLPSNGVIMMLLEGHHSVNHRTLDFGSPTETTNLHVKGLGRTSEIVIHKLTSGFRADKVILENLSFFSMYPFICSDE